MVARIGLWGARAEVALMVAGVAAGCGAEVVVVDGQGGGADPEAVPGASSPGESLDVLLVDAMGGARRAFPAEGGSPVSGLLPEVPPSVRVLMLHLEGEADAARGRASAWGAEQVVELPSGQGWLARELLDLTGPSGVLAVLGAVGGAGTTTVALGCAAAAGSQAAASAGPDEEAACLLVDADPCSTGLDLPLGIPDGHGARWSSIPPGTGALVADSLRASLPRAGGLCVLTGVIDGPAEPRVGAVLRTGREDFPSTILDAGRGGVPAGLGARDAVAVVTPATLAGVVGTQRVVALLPTRRVVLAVRPTGWLPSDEVAAQVGVSSYVEVPTVRGLAERMDCGDVLVGRTGRSLRRVGRDVWEALR